MRGALRTTIDAMSHSPSVLRITYPARRAVLASYRLDGPTLSLFVPTHEEVPLGEEVLLEVGFGDAPQRFTLRGKVTWRRAESRGMRLEPGLGIAFSGGDKYGPAQMLAYCAGRPLELGTAQDARFRSAIPCRVQVGKRHVRAKVRDISNSGVFVAGKGLATLSPGRELTLTLEPGWFGWGGKTFQARVIWSGDKGGHWGCGVRFMGQPTEIRPAIKKYLVKKSA